MNEKKPTYDSVKTEISDFIRNACIHQKATGIVSDVRISLDLMDRLNHLSREEVSRLQATFHINRGIARVTA